MKIAFVISQMAGGGAERVISVLSDQMANKGAVVSILMTAGAKVEYDLNPLVRVVQVGDRTAGNPLNFVKRIRNLRRCFKTDRYDVILAFTPAAGLYSIMAGLFLRNRVFVSERNDPAKHRHKFWRWIAYSCSERVVFQTEAARDYFRGRIRKKGIVLPNPLREDLPDVFGGERTKRIVAVGRLEPQKDYPLLIDAFSQFYRDHPSYSLHIYGKGYLLKDLQILVDQRSMQDCVHFEGFSDNILMEIRDASMFVMSSSYEGMPNALMEAMALGLPVISTDCPTGGVRELIDQGVNGLLVKCGDGNALAGAMARIADDMKFATTLGQRGTEIRDKYKAQKVCEQWMKAIS